ncbi:MAG TPA: response regulator, partial [Burkholderiales bacterium]|nr:response regulator [Burkholderiales bacterium]
RDSQQSYDTREECVEAAQRAPLNAESPVDARVAVREAVVLCVQPDPLLRASLQQGLADFQAVLAASSLEAIRLVSSSTFDAYVLDYWLPGSSGVHLCRHIRRTDPHTPICFYTTATDEDQRRRAFGAGATAWVCASAGAASLREELRSVLDRAELQSARAKAEAERALQEELERRGVAAIDHTETARVVAAERAARAKAYARFSVSGGTPAHFERWWSKILSGVPQTIATSSSKRHGGAGQA